jgi:hypothetical protein
MDALTVAESRYYQDLLYRVIKIGTEIEFALPKGVLREDFQPGIEEALQPSRDMNTLGQLGVYDVIKEHCGIEILVIGRHPHWEALQEQYSRILLPLLEEKIRMRPTCGLHFHLLSPGLAEDIPEIILANFWNLSRLYAPGLKFITAAGAGKDKLCRRRQHNAHLEFMRLSAADHSMEIIQQRLKDSLDVPEHQNFFNLEHVRFNEQNIITDFHVEMRYPDGDLCPTSITAKTFLLLTLLLKSVEISKFGLIDAPSEDFMRNNTELMDKISNNDGKLATSDTEKIDSRQLAEYQVNACDLLRFLKSIFLLLDNPAELVLQDLAERPIALRRDCGLSWQAIEGELQQAITPPHNLDQLDYELIKIIELGLLDGSVSAQRWLERTADKLELTADEISHRLAQLANRSPSWQKELGSMVFLR